jgi:hypothetical protein
MKRIVIIITVAVSVALAGCNNDSGGQHAGGAPSFGTDQPAQPLTPTATETADACELFPPATAAGILPNIPLTQTSKNGPNNFDCFYQYGNDAKRRLLKLIYNPNVGAFNEANNTDIAAELRDASEQTADELGAEFTTADVPELGDNGYYYAWQWMGQDTITVEWMEGGTGFTLQTYAPVSDSIDFDTVLAAAEAAHNG